MIFRAFSSFFVVFLFLGMARTGAAQPLPDRFPLGGFALDANSKPLSGAIITLRRQSENGSYAFWGGETTSDARGVFRFERAETGRYYLNAEFAGFAPISSQIIDWKLGDAPLRLRFERLVTLELQLFAPQSAATATKNEGPTSVPLAQSPVWVRLRGDGSAGQSTRRAQTDNEGKISVAGLLPAIYSIYISTPRGYMIQSGVALQSEAAPSYISNPISNPIPLRVSLQPGGTLEVSVTQKNAASSEPTETPRFVGGIILSLTAANAAESTRLLGVSASSNENFALLASGNDSIALTSRDGDGTIEVLQLPPGNYIARGLLPSGTLSDAQPVTIASGQIARVAFEALLAPQSQAALTLTLRRNSLSAGATDPDPKTATAEAASGEFSLRILPIDAKGALIRNSEESPETLALWPGGTPARRARADKNGQITIFPLRIGRYRVFVTPRSLSLQQNGATKNEDESVSLDIDVPASGASATLILPALAASQGATP